MRCWPIKGFLITAVMAGYCYQVSGQLLLDSLDGGTSWGVFCFYDDTLTDRFLMGGGFGYANDTLVVRGLAAWDGVGFDSIGCAVGNSCTQSPSVAFANPPRVIDRWSNDLFVAGDFPYFSGDTMNHIARWDGVDWHSLGSGTDGVVRGMKSYPDGLYVAGWFHQADTVPAEGLARWDGTQWHSVFNLPFINGSSSSNQVNDLAWYDGELYIGGNFNGLTGNSLAKWNGSNWVAVAPGFNGTFATVNRLKVHDGLLYVAGHFADSGPLGVATNPGNGIVAYDGQNWFDLNGGTLGSDNPSVVDMLWLRDTLYVVGNFNRMGGVDAEWLARWDGHQWCALTPPDYFYYTATAIGTYRDTLYVGGSFFAVGPDSTPMAHVAKWIGGSHTDTCGFWTSVSDTPLLANPILSLYPNPGNGILNISLPSLRGLLRIYGPDGRLVHQVRPHNVRVQLDASTWRRGLYLVAWQGRDGQRLSERWIKE